MLADRPRSRWAVVVVAGALVLAAIGWRLLTDAPQLTEPPSAPPRVAVVTDSDVVDEGVAVPAVVTTQLGPGSEFQVNSYTTNTQQLPAVSSSAAGDLVVPAVGCLSSGILCRAFAVGRDSQVGRAGTERRRGRAPDPALEVDGAPDAPHL